MSDAAAERLRRFVEIRDDESLDWVARDDAGNDLKDILADAAPLVADLLESIPKAMDGHSHFGSGHVVGRCGGCTTMAAADRLRVAILGEKRDD